MESVFRIVARSCNLYSELSPSNSNQSIDDIYLKGIAFDLGFEEEEEEVEELPSLEEKES